MRTLYDDAETDPIIIAIKEAVYLSDSTGQPYAIVQSKRSTDGQPADFRAVRLSGNVLRPLEVIRPDPNAGDT
jgi:hypothetical protein